MGIREDFKNYWDGNGLLAPNPGTWGISQSGSDNGVLFTSVYYIMLAKNGELTNEDKIVYSNKIESCIGSDLLNRVPTSQNDGLESVDDYYSTLSACIELGNTSIPRKLLWGCIKYKGSMDNMSPGTWQWQDVLIRQPALLTAMISASFPSLLNPFHWLIRLLFFSLFPISAIILAISNMWDDLYDTNSRQLAWLLQNNLKKTSLMCWLGSQIWLWRLRKEYPNQMKDIAGIYYSPKGLDQNPYSKYWIT